MKKTIAMLCVGLMVACGVAFASVQGDLRKTITNIGTAEALSSTGLTFKQATICAETNNTGVIVIGASTAVASTATRRGVPLNAGDCYTIACENASNCGNLDEVFADTTVDTDGVTVHYTRQIIV